MFEYFILGLEPYSIFASLVVGVIFGALALKKDKLPLLTNVYMLLVCSLFILNLSHPKPFYFIILTISGALCFFPIAIRKIASNSVTKEDMYLYISKYLFILSLIIQAIGTILTYETHPGYVFGDT